MHDHAPPRLDSSTQTHLTNPWAVNIFATLWSFSAPNTVCSPYSLTEWRELSQVLAGIVRCRRRGRHRDPDLVTWLDGNVERRYFPTKNPGYQAAEDTRAYPFRDLRQELLGLTKPPGLPDDMGRNAGRP